MAKRAIERTREETIQWIKDEIWRRKWRNKDFAMAYGVSRQTVSDLLNGYTGEMALLKAANWLAGEGTVIYSKKYVFLPK